jgi:hypothetical protein
MHRDLQAFARCLEEEIGHAPTLLDAKEDPLARCAERKDPVEARVYEEVDERLECARWTASG